MTHNIYIYIAVMAAVTIAIRVLPLTVIRRRITNRFLRSFLYYIPYVTLALMTFPAIIDATGTPAAGIIAFAAGIILAWFGVSLLGVSAACCAAVFISELVLCL